MDAAEIRRLKPKLVKYLEEFEVALAARTRVVT